jgi:hypothetical protein
VTGDTFSSFASVEAAAASCGLVFQIGGTAISLQAGLKPHLYRFVEGCVKRGHDSMMPTEPILRNLP